MGENQEMVQRSRKESNAQREGMREQSNTNLERFRNRAIESGRVALVTTHGYIVHGWPGTFVAEEGEEEGRKERKRGKDEEEQQ